MAVPVPDTIPAYVPVLISVLALIGSVVSVWISVQNYRNAKREKSPLLHADVRSAGQPGWFRVSVSLRSRDNFGLHAKEIVVKRPLRSKIITMQQALAALPPKKPWAGYDLQVIPDISGATKRAECKLSVASAGSAGAFFHGIRMTDSDSHSAIFFVFAGERRWSKSLVLKASIFTVEPRERRIVITLKRTLPTERRIAND